MKYSLAALILVFFATVRVIADVSGMERLSAAAAVTNVAPAMKVFTAHKGYETYSATFELAVNYGDGKLIVNQLNASNYSGLKGPYNRRNVYGALISYGPILVNNPATQRMWSEMAQKSLCGPSSVLSELGFDNVDAVTSTTIRYLRQVQADNDYPSELVVYCEGR